MTQENDNLTRPEYYDPNSPYEARKVIKAWDLGFNLGTGLKYIQRAGKKQYDGLTLEESKVEDLKKIITYATFELEIAREEAQEALKNDLDWIPKARGAKSSDEPPKPAGHYIK